jgi:hypothetical protein
MKPRRWFARWGWIHRPVGWPGWLAFALAFVFCLQVFVAVDRRSHSVSDTFYGILPFVLPALIVLEWVASKTDGGPD